MTPNDWMVLFIVTTAILGFALLIAMDVVPRPRR